jgi:hypothetical protein
MFAATEALTLAHDILEHWDHAQKDPNLQELVAMGSILAHREHDFYNKMGDFTLGSEIADQLRCLASYPQKLPKINPEVSDTVREAWPSVVSELAGWDITEGLETLFDIACAYMSRGYRHVETINIRTGAYYGFNTLWATMLDALDTGLRYTEPYDGCRLNVSYSFRHNLVNLGRVRSAW